MFPLEYFIPIPAPVVHATPAPVTECEAPVLSDFLEPLVPVVEVLQVPEVRDPQLTSESLGTTPVWQVKPARIVDVAGLEPPLATEPVSPLLVTTPVVEAPSVVEHVQPDPVKEYAAPASAATFGALAPVDEHIAPAPAVTNVTSASVPASAFKVDDLGFDVVSRRHC